MVLNLKLKTKEEEEARIYPVTPLVAIVTRLNFSFFSDSDLRDTVAPPSDHDVDHTIRHPHPQCVEAGRARPASAYCLPPSAFTSMNYCVRAQSRYCYSYKTSISLSWCYAAPRRLLIIPNVLCFCIIICCLLLRNVFIPSHALHIYLAVCCVFIVDLLVYELVSHRVMVFLLLYHRLCYAIYVLFALIFLVATTESNSRHQIRRVQDIPSSMLAPTKSLHLIIASQIA
ncbi:hypothetical protein NEOLEDRAFT_360796 [Neolentinus lepideus HHB14362 ss-1]|uniref:Uncharacterized protein n=1 Tax=Neolentinus lepideus HHB14362 ss-1 TaxID=1314782 RepID=A0A165SN43_9AGAM|nr:hypothetical protein NEOLEDRAFT_360796 [Neolentinus lepideus HHB14362 ss-1]